MPPVKRLQFSISILAPVSAVFRLMTDAESFRKWTSAFTEGSFFESSWDEGERIRFLSPSGNGMLAEIVANIPDRLISIKHIGYIRNGVEDTDSESVGTWAPAFENYSFEEVDSGTRVLIDQDIMDEFEESIEDAWPTALEKLKTLCEAQVRL